jgi:hypothetical protein
MSSLSITASALIKPIATSGVLAGALVWALAAVVLPWLVRGRSPALDLVLVSIWAAITVSATSAVIALSSTSHSATGVPTAVGGALAGAVVALAPALRNAWVNGRHQANLAPETP